MKRCVLMAAALALFVGWLDQAKPGTVVLSDTGRGWLYNKGGDNGNAPDNNYQSSGFVSFGRAFFYSNHFDFSIPTISGTITSATLTLDNNGHSGPLNYYRVYSLGAFGTYSFSDIGTGTLYGSTTISSNGTVAISLDDAALADISADQGGRFSLGGADSGSMPPEWSDFSTGATTLTLDVAEVPEPVTLTLVAIGIAGMAGYAWRRRRNSKV
jgi:hypothetical protein